MPTIIHVSTKFFMEACLCELFGSLTALSQYVHLPLGDFILTFDSVSHTDFGRVYNLALGDSSGHRRRDLKWGSEMRMDQENVEEGFCIYSLLLEYQHRDLATWLARPFTVPNSSTTHRSGRFRGIMIDRNHRFSSFLRPESNHACDGCSAILERDGKPG